MSDMIFRDSIGELAVCVVKTNCTSGSAAFIALLPAIKKRPAGRFFSDDLPVLLHTVLVLAGAGVDFDLVAGCHKQRYRQRKTGVDLGRLHDFA